MRSVSAVLIVLAALCFGQTCAFGAVSSDAPASTAATGAAAEKDEKVDARLSQKVTYTAKRKTVVAILTDLSKISGVTLKAGRNDADWQVTDRRMNVFAKDIPLLTLMNSMARVMEFEWSRSKEADPPTYRLYMDRATAAEQEKQLSEQEDRVRDKESRMRGDTFDRIAGLGSLSDSDLQKLKTDNPYLYALAVTGAARSAMAFLSAFPQAKEAFLDGRSFETPVSSLSAEARATVAQAVRDQWKLSGFNLKGVSISGRTVGPETAILPNSLMDELMGKMDVVISGREGRGFNGINLGSIGFRLPGQHLMPGFGGVVVSLRVMNPDDSVAKYWGRVWTESLAKPDASYKEILSQVNAEKIIPSAEKYQEEKQAQLQDLGEAQIEHDDDPELNVKLADPAAQEKPVVQSDANKEKPKKPTYDDVMEAIAKRMGMLVVSDAFWKAGESGELPEPTTTRQALDKIQVQLVYNWWRKGSIIELRDRFWRKKRAMQVSDATLARWRNAVRTPGSIGLDELAEMALLSVDQYSVNIVGDAVLGGPSIHQACLNNADLLKFYAGLDIRSKGQLLSQGGLSLDGLSDEQIALVGKFLGQRGLHSPPDRPCALVCTKGTSYGKPVYLFQLRAVDSGDMVGEWEVAFL